jgi:hypothetical protein
MVNLRPSTREYRTLGLLGVCRQIYAETVVVPFQTGIFLLKDETYDRMWLLNLARAQLQAITTIHLDDQGSSWDCCSFGWTLTLKEILPKLPGLKQIHVLNGLVRSCRENRMRMVLDKASQREKKLKELIKDLAKDVEITFDRKSMSIRACILRSLRRGSSF